MLFVLGVVGEDGVGEYGGGGVGEVGVDHDVDVVSGEDLEGGGEGGLGEGVGVLRQEEWAGGVLVATVVDDGLGDSGDVVFVEGGFEGAAAVAGGAEGYSLRGDGGVGMEGVVGGDEAGEIDQVGWERKLAGLVGGLSLLVAHAVGVPLWRVRFVMTFACWSQQLYGMRVVWEMNARRAAGRIRDDTEVAAEGACVLEAVSLKRE